MRDLYLKIPEKQTLIDFLSAQEVVITDLNGVEHITHPYIMEGNYFQNEALIIDFIGKIPKSFSEDGDVIEWKSDEHFNVRLINEGVTLFDAFMSVYPEVPYRIFS